VQQLETFSYSIVHDMRAPLRSMRSFAALLEAEHAEDLDEQARDYLARIMNSASRLDALITDVLAYSRVSMTQAEPHRVELDLLLTEILNHYPQFEEAGPPIHVARPLPP
jgi:light-regulated signal transduction histidine kinase (bacteriophytochrome)